jgi:hypothetical protein
MSELLQGQLVVLKDLITSDAAGLVPVDDVTDAVMVYKPDGLGGLVAVTPAPTVSHVGAANSGQYSAQYTFDQPGWHEIVFTSTTTGAGKGRARVYVSPVP